MTKAQTLAALENQLDSFYSLQQVIAIIEGIAEPEVKTQLDQDIIDDISGAIERCLDNNNGTDLVDVDNIELSLGYNNFQIEIDSAAIDIYRIMQHINRILEDYVAKKV